MALLNLCMKFKRFFGQKYSFEALRKCHLEKNIHNMPQGPPNPGFMQEKSTKRGFSKTAIMRIEFFLLLFNLGSYESLEGLGH